jgi:hypothetical protein
MLIAVFSPACAVCPHAVPANSAVLMNDSLTAPLGPALLSGKGHGLPAVLVGLGAEPTYNIHI